MRNWSKLGYYPTPPDVTELIADRVGTLVCHTIPARHERAEETGIRILDPCCGEGVAAARFGERLLERANMRKNRTHGGEPAGLRDRAAPGAGGRGPEKTVPCLERGHRQHTNPGAERRVPLAQSTLRLDARRRRRRQPAAGEQVPAPDDVGAEGEGHPDLHHPGPRAGP